jgi:hypothetical protein
MRESKLSDFFSVCHYTLPENTFPEGTALTRILRTMSAKWTAFTFLYFYKTHKKLTQTCPRAFDICLFSKMSLLDKYV